MSGHNKWSTIKHKKAREDAKRGKIFTRIIREVTVAARLGGGDPDANPRLRAAIQLAKGANMPSDNIERGIKKGTGELEGVAYEEVMYEGYGPSGVAILVEAVTDNKTRTVADIRHIFTKYGGSMAEPNAVAWQFSRVGNVLVNAESFDEDELMLVALEAGAEDVRKEEDAYVIQTSSDELFQVHQSLEAAGVHCLEANLSFNAQNPLDVPEDKTASVLRLLEALDDYDDVQQLHTNASLQD